MPETDLFLASRLIDCSLENHDNRHLGVIEDVVIATASGEITHLVAKIETGALSSKRILVSYGEVLPQYDRRVFLIRAQPEELKQREAISFDLSHRGKEIGAPKGRGASASWDADPPHG